MLGVWLFYVQHQFEDTYWEHHETWDFFDAGIQGSSHYALPKPLQWFTANIGLHHIHHVSSKIPNYKLQECFDENPEFRRVEEISGMLGVWLFYVQHQFEDTYWEHHETWDFFDAGIQGSSHYALPKPLQWFTANIGLHHIHHVSSKIPNYKLQECFDENPEFRRVTSLHLLESLKCLFLTLWDEEQSKLVGFKHLRTLRAGV